MWWGQGCSASCAVWCPRSAPCPPPPQTQQKPWPSSPWQLCALGALVPNPGRGKELMPCAAPADLPSPGGGPGQRASPLPWPGPCSHVVGHCKELLLTAPGKAWACHYVLVQKIHVTKNNVISRAMEVVEAVARPSAGLAPRGERPLQLPAVGC